MNRDAIQKTAICSFDAEEELYKVESPLLNICAGVAETEAEAWYIFDDLLKAMYISYLEDKQVGQYAKRGRPAKNRVSLNCQVQPETLENVKELSANLNISQGECVDYLYAVYLSWMNSKSTKSSAKVASMVQCVEKRVLPAVKAAARKTAAAKKTSKTKR